jgi:hypothetical protein
MIKNFNEFLSEKEKLTNLNREDFISENAYTDYLDNQFKDRWEKILKKYDFESISPISPAPKDLKSGLNKWYKSDQGHDIEFILVTGGPMSELYKMEKGKFVEAPKSFTTPEQVDLLLKDKNFKWYKTEF